MECTHGVWEMSLNDSQRVVLSLEKEEEATQWDIVEDTLDDAANDTSCGLEEEGQSKHEDGDVMSDDDEARWGECVVLRVDC